MKTIMLSSIHHCVSYYSYTDVMGAKVGTNWNTTWKHRFACVIKVKGLLKK